MAEALLVMCLGMGGVFCFLVLLVLLMLVLVRLAPERPASPVLRAGLDERTRLAVIQAAISAYEADLERERA